MSYRKARIQHDEISLWLTHSTYSNTPEREKQCVSITQHLYPSSIQQCHMCIPSKEPSHGWLYKLWFKYRTHTDL